MSQHQTATVTTTPAQDHRGCGNEECGWTGVTTRMCGTIGPLCPECGETTESLASPSSHAEQITRFLETVHVGYALAAGEVISEDTIADHLSFERKACIETGQRSGLYLLLRFPALRGVMSFEAANNLAAALAKDDLELNDEAVGLRNQAMQH